MRFTVSDRFDLFRAWELVRTARAVAFFSLAMLLGSGFAVESIALAQQPQAGIRITAVRVEGSVRVEMQTILSFLTLKEGQAFDVVAADKALKGMFATGMFSDVTLNMEGSVLVVKVSENPMINRVAFEGNRKIEDDKLRDEIQSKARTVFTRARVQSDAERLLTIYRRGGRYNAVVEPKIIHLEQNRVDLVFEIAEGDVTGIKRIGFVGNAEFSDGALRQKIRTVESAWWRFLSSDDRFDPDRLQLDRELLRKFYLSEGYADFRVESAIAELSPDRSGFFITFTINEGPRYKFGAIDVATRLPDLSAKSLKDHTTISEGDWYNAEEVEKTSAALSEAAGALGYAFADTRPKLARNRETKTIGITFEIQEGPRTYVDRIEIEGNTRTLDKVIRREFRLAEGDAFSSAKVRRSQERIRSLGFFEKVDVVPQPGAAPDKTNLKVTVTEKSTGDISFGAGYSTSSGILGTISATERNLLGKGQTARLSLSLGSTSSAIELSFTEPYFMDRAVRAGFDIFDTTTNKQSSTAYASSSIGFALRAGWDYTEHTSQTWRYTLKQTSIYDIDYYASSSVRSQAGTYITSEVSESTAWDTRDQRLSPTKGWLIRNSVAIAGLGGDDYYFRTTVDASIYQQIVEDVVFSLSGTAGMTLPVNNTTLRLNNRFYIGGDSLPGWAVGGIGPRDANTGDSLGGKYFYTGISELSFPLGLPKEIGLVGKAFVDVGSLWGGIQDAGVSLQDSMLMRVGTGLGVQWVSPFGPIRVDYTIPLVKESYDKTQTIRFSVGSRF